MQNHHAYLVYANSLEESVVPLEFQKVGVDTYHIVIDSLGIDDVRTLTEKSIQRPFESDVCVFVIVARIITVQAQNALLKLFEEPPTHAQFYVVVPSTAFLLPTLKSRLAELGTRNVQQKQNAVFDIFFKTSYADRLSSIAEHTKVKDTVWIEEIVRGCEYFAHAATKNKAQILASVLLVRTYIGTNGASPKMLLEELALVLPL
jgi:DNA polymerase III delta prime subunit